MPDDVKKELVLSAFRSRQRSMSARSAAPIADPVLTFAQSAQQSDDTLSFGQIMAAFRRNWWLVLGLLVVTISASVVYTRMATRMYQSSATIRIDDTESASSVLTGVAALPGLSKGKIQTEMEVLQSRQLSENVARALNFKPLRGSVDALLKNLSVTRPNKDAQVVKVQFESRDPSLAAAVPNLLLDEFMRYKAQTTKTEASSAVTFLRQQVPSYDAQLQVAESALADFSERAQVVSIADEATEQVKRMASLQAERDELQAERQSLASILSKQPGTNGGEAKDIAAFPSFIANRGIQDILQSLILLENQKSDLLVRRNPENADVVAVTSRISALEGQLTQTARAYVSGLDSKLTSLNTQVATFGRRAETIPAREIAFARLSRQQKLLEDISILLQTRLKEAEIKEAVEPGDVRVIDRALVPDNPTSPRPVINILVGTLAGLFLGFVAAMVRETLDNTVRTREDVQNATGGIPILAAIPRMQGSHHFSLKKAKKKRGGAALASFKTPSEMLVTRAGSRDPAAEAYRALRTNITFAAADHSNQALVLTSALPGDGKSTTAANLAITLVQQGVRTLLIDADLRKGVLHKMFGIHREPGLSQLLIGQSSLAAAIQSVPVGDDGQRLHVLTSGHLPPNPAELLGSETMRSLLEDLRQQYDMILFDTPPLTLVTDAAVLGTLADSTMLIARAAVTDKRALHQAAAQLYHLSAHVSGTIVNDLDTRETGYGYGYGYAPGYVYGGAEPQTA